jgi:negative regulator of flagellin synthesis FlgM
MTMETRPKGQRMRISSNNTGAGAISRSAETAPAEASGDAAAPGVFSSSAAQAPLQSAVLQPALAAMRDMPEIDHQRVAELRDALAKGELPFDPSKLAGLIQRFHGGEA